MKRLLLIAVSLASCFCLAVKASIYEEGACGEYVNWQIETNGVLTISGFGRMWDYPGQGTCTGVPWCDFKYFLKTVVITGEVTYVGRDAFKFSDVLESVIIGDSVTEIGAGAFYDDYALKNVTIGSGVTTIGTNAFASCSALEKVIMGDHVTSINSGAFGGCSSLKAITLPDSLTSIDSGAFSGCKLFTSVVIPASVSYINETAFSGCSSLESLSVSDENQYYSVVDGILFNKNLTSLVMCLATKTSAIIPESVTYIADYAFAACDSMKSVSLGNDYALSLFRSLFNYQKIEHVSLGNGVTIIGDGVFTDCNKLQFNEEDNGLFLGTEDNPRYALVRTKDKSITSLTLDENTKVIANSAFEDCSMLSSMIIPSSITSIGNKTFYHCTSLASVTIPDSVVSIGFRAFGGCNALKSVSIPASVTNISRHAFNDCGDGDSGCSSVSSVSYAGLHDPGENDYYGCYYIFSCKTSVTVTDDYQDDSFCGIMILKDSAMRYEVSILVWLLLAALVFFN